MPFSVKNSTRRSRNQKRDDDSAMSVDKELNNLREMQDIVFAKAQTLINDRSDV